MTELLSCCCPPWAELVIQTGVLLLGGYRENDWFSCPLRLFDVWMSSSLGSQPRHGGRLHTLYWSIVHKLMRKTYIMWGNVTNRVVIHVDYKGKFVVCWPPPTPAVRDYPAYHSGDGMSACVGAPAIVTDDHKTDLLYYFKIVYSYCILACTKYSYTVMVKLAETLSPVSLLQ